MPPGDRRTRGNRERRLNERRRPRQARRWSDRRRIAFPLFNRGAGEVARWTAERTRTDLERAALEAEIRAQITRAAESFALRRQSSAAVSTALTWPTN